ncbi:hypothetical protein E2C01_027717 [Portunus trituberculatus]|uniref:Uncharacterized protein n=1 Tax=Portunus trituberculatus TaxID=210409 RepID=A0A5B7EJF0_PORTR|nr:hypothetical protein [Portunus trituberculatus]
MPKKSQERKGHFRRLVKAQLHPFCNASTKAYAVVTYIKLQDNTGFIHCSFLMACTRLAPIKAMSIPQLELCAVVLAAGADAKLRWELSLLIMSSTFWTASTTVLLHYIASPSKRFRTFVANHLGLIHRLSSPQQWRHVTSGDNPADDATRGLSA